MGLSESWRHCNSFFITTNFVCVQVLPKQILNSPHYYPILSSLDRRVSELHVKFSPKKMGDGDLMKEVHSYYTRRLVPVGIDSKLNFASPNVDWGYGIGGGEDR